MFALDERLIRLVLQDDELLSAVAALFKTAVFREEDLHLLAVVAVLGGNSIGLKHCPKIAP